MGYTTPEVLVASNANVGGPATAGALATGKGWTSLVVPGMLVVGRSYGLSFTHRAFTPRLHSSVVSFIAQ